MRGQHGGAAEATEVQLFVRASAPLLNPSYHDQFAEQPGTRGAHPDSVAIISRRAFKKQLVEGAGRGKAA